MNFPGYQALCYPKIRCCLSIQISDEDVGRASRQGFQESGMKDTILISISLSMDAKIA